MALSRSISAFSPSRSTVERSRPPINLIALASKSPSSVTVVRIAILHFGALIIASPDAVNGAKNVRESLDSSGLLQRAYRAADPVNKAGIGRRWLLWHRFPHENHTQ